MSTCANCDAKLGTNTLLADYPIGSTLAYDAGMPHLWAVCPKCRFWNLSYLDDSESRALISELERHYSAAVTKSGDKHVGVAEIAGRGTIVRVGGSAWRHFAAWRFGTQLLKRRRIWHLRLALGMALALGVYSAPIDQWLLSGAGMITFVALLFGYTWLHSHWPLYRGADTGGRDVVVRVGDVPSAMIAGTGDRWTLVVGEKKPAVLEGRAAAIALSRVLRARNIQGASRRQLDEAIDLIERAGGPHEMFDGWLSATMKDEHVLVGELPATARVALEMAAQEEVERRALEIDLRSTRNALRAARDRQAEVALL